MTITAAGKINLNFQLTICSRSVKITNASGGIAQLGERLNGIQEVSGSIPLISTKQIRLESVSFRVFFAFTGMFCPEKLLNLRLAFLLKNGLVCSVSVIAQHVFFTKHRLFCANRRNLHPDNTLTYHHWCARSIQACLYPRLLHAS